MNDDQKVGPDPDPSAQVQDDLDQAPTTSADEIDEMPDEGVPDPDDRAVEDGVGFHDTDAEVLDLDPTEGEYDASEADESDEEDA